MAVFMVFNLYFDSEIKNKSQTLIWQKFRSDPNYNMFLSAPAYCLF